MKLEQMPPEAEQNAARAQMQQKIRRRKRARFLQGCRAAGMMLLFIVAVAAAALAIHHFAVERYFPLEQPAGPVPAIEPEAPLPETLTEERVPASQPDLPALQPDLSEEQAGPAPKQPQEPDTAAEQEPPSAPQSAQPEPYTYLPAEKTADTRELDLELYSENAILIDLQANTILAEKNADARIYPASMTKIMTALIACESITDWDATYTMTQQIIDRYFLADATMAGFLAGERVTMRDLVYGAVLPSGAEATYALADAICGSEEAFAQRMNERAAELGLTDTHFVDASGLHDDEHYTTLRDMAIILQAALDNDMCREVLCTARYTSAATEQNPEGVEMINKFLVRLETQDLQGADIAAAKTGYTAEAMNCCASFGTAPDGRECICVTAKAWTSWYAIADQIALYCAYDK